MIPTRRDELNLLSARQKAVYNQQYVDEYGVVYIGNKKGKLERRSGTSISDVNDAITTFAIENQSTISQQPGTTITSTSDGLHPFLLMGG